jgi:tetratricopeptide (TPR) repeat protein
MAALTGGSLLRAIVVAGFIAAAALFARRVIGMRGTSAEAAQPLSALAAPGRDNVAPSYHTGEMKLRARVQADASDTAALAALGRMLQDAHRPAEAIGYYERYTKLAPANRQVWLDLAVMYGELNDWGAAGRAIDAVLERSPGDPVALFDRGAVEANRGDRTSARTWFERAASQATDTSVSRAAREALARISPR